MALAEYCFRSVEPAIIILVWEGMTFLANQQQVPKSAGHAPAPVVHAHTSTSESTLRLMLVEHLIKAYSAKCGITNAPRAGEIGDGDLEILRKEIEKVKEEIVEEKNIADSMSRKKRHN